MLNRLKYLSFIFCLFLLLIISAGRGLAFDLSHRQAQELLKGRFAQDELIVKFKNSSRPYEKIKITGGITAEKLAEFLQRDDVIFAEPNYLVQAFFIPNDPYYSYQWFLENPVNHGINIASAWDITKGANVKVAIIDTGIAYENYSSYLQAPDLAQTCFLAGYDFVNDDSHPNDDNGHGTHLAGVIAQGTNNNYGVAGIAFKSCLMPIKSLDRTGSGSYADVADGIYWAADHGAQIINLSLGGSQSSDALKEAVKYAYEKGVVVIAAAGNDNANYIAYPAAYDDYVIAVGATQADQQRAPYSNYGSSLDLVAPGGNLSIDQNKDSYGDGILQQSFSSSPTSFGYYFREGTSMASPIVAGVAALVISQNQNLTPSQVRQALEQTAKDLGAQGKDNYYGWGLVDAYAALQYVGGQPPQNNDYDNDGVLNDQDACPNTYGSACNGCPNSCSGCAVMSCQNGTLNAPTCTVGSCANTICPTSGCGVGGCAVTEYVTYTPAANTCNISNNIGACSSNSCQITCAADSRCQVPANQLRVSDILLQSETLNFGYIKYCRVTATVYVQNSSNQPVSSAKVYAHWSGAYSRTVSANTDSSGKTSFKTSLIRNCGNFNFCVDNITKSNFTYNPSLNTKTCASITLP